MGAVNVEQSEFCQNALIPVIDKDFLCEENVFYDDEYDEEYTDAADPESPFHSIDSTSSFVRKLNGLDVQKASGENDATSGSSKRKMMDQDNLDTATTGLKRPKV